MLVYLFLINALGFVLMLADKRKAQKNRWRIPESTLIATAILGGSLGTIAGMRIARHKTKHPKFYLGLPFIFAVQVIVAVLILSLGPLLS
ncbi:MAG: DUF1294 domain-containing protein [Oscillospiraceae bacterium]|nr:DUF1294 domain-containing protein [Oscillospiraceae bacterium]